MTCSIDYLEGVAITSLRKLCLEKTLLRTRVKEINALAKHLIASYIQTNGLILQKFEIKVYGLVIL